LINNSFSDLLNIIPFFILFIPNVAFVLGIGLKYATILWSIGSEEQFYLIWPWLFKCLKTRNFIIINLIIIIVWTIGPHIIDFINYNYLNEGKLIKNGVKIMTRISFNSMATGAIFACILFQKNKITKVLYSKSLQLINISLIIFFLLFKILPFIAFVDQIYALLFGILILNLAGNKNTILNLENKWLKYLGKISFGIYVFHLIMIDFTYFLVSYLNFEINKHLLLVMSLILTIIISSISYEFFEKPFINLKNKFYSFKK
jgi:peptidoglycan/LPS O-acetylase OafA/YrhL